VYRKITSSGICAPSKNILTLEVGTMSIFSIFLLPRIISCMGIGDEMDSFNSGREHFVGICKIMPALTMF